MKPMKDVSPSQVHTMKALAFMDSARISIEQARGSGATEREESILYDIECRLKGTKLRMKDVIGDDQ